MERWTLFANLALAAGAGPAFAQTPSPNATYITKEEVETVNKTPGIDRTIQVVDLGDQHFAVGVIHRGAIAAPGVAASKTAPDAPACGTDLPSAPAGLTPGLLHDKQTEGYYVLSGEGVLVTGGQIINGHAEAPGSDVVARLNGPSCRGDIGGPGVVKRLVRTGDIVIIPAGVPHGWAEVKDHVDYLSFRPSRDALTAGYVNPVLTGR